MALVSKLSIIKCLLYRLAIWLRARTPAIRTDFFIEVKGMVSVANSVEVISVATSFEVILLVEPESNESIGIGGKLAERSRRIQIEFSRYKVRIPDDLYTSNCTHYSHLFFF